MEREGERDRDLSFGSFTSWLQQLGLGKSNPETWNSVQISHVGDRDPLPATLVMHIGRKLGLETELVLKPRHSNKDGGYLT